MKNQLIIFLTISILSACSEKTTLNKGDYVIAEGRMPNLVKDSDDIIHLTYGYGDSIMYAYSADKGQSFSSPSLIFVLPKLAASHTRGPQIAASNSGLTVIACNSLGDIFSFYKQSKSTWKPGGKVNDVDTVAKEGLMALDGHGDIAFAAWLDLRENAQNKIYGSRSNDGGMTWSKNIMIYTSPDTTVCECCKPSVAVSGKNIYVMFRNWLDSNRDMFVIQSMDGGNTFGKAQQLGNGNWKLNGCPMDGGNLAINNMGNLQTVWRRKTKIYAATPGNAENEIGAGKGCTMETVNGKNVYAWIENGEIVFIKPGGEKKVLGKGSQAVLKGVNDDHVICVWENEKQIHGAVVGL
ncbi:MAG: sialidase family protein [Chitinophagaceae bacterium]